jgi:hypothetical protein
MIIKMHVQLLKLLHSVQKYEVCTNRSSPSFSKVHHHKFDIMAPRANIFDYAQRATSFGLLGLGVSF